MANKKFRRSSNSRRTNSNRTDCTGLTEVELWGDCSEQEINFNYGCNANGSYDIESTTSIELFNSGLTGSIPPEIVCLTNLTKLKLQSNQLTGEIPSEIGNLTNLEELHLYNNQLTGEIPSTIGDLTNLWSLRLYNNQLGCKIYDSDADECVVLCNGTNGCSGEIPSSIENLTNLTHLWLSYNHLTGEIPSEIVNLTYLYWFNLSYNQLTGSIPLSIGDLTNLYYLNLEINQLTGPIPTSIGNLTNLTYLHLSGNQLTGEIPSEIGNLTNLTILRLDDNQFCCLPQEICNVQANNSWFGANNFCEDSHWDCISDYSWDRFGIDPQECIESCCLEPGDDNDGEPEEEACTHIVWCCPEIDGVLYCGDKLKWCCGNYEDCCSGENDTVVIELNPKLIWEDWSGECGEGENVYTPAMCCEDSNYNGECDSLNPYDWDWSCEGCDTGWINIDGIIPPTIYDCTDSTALNYNPIATGCESGTMSCCEYSVGHGGGQGGGPPPADCLRCKSDIECFDEYGYTPTGAMICNMTYTDEYGCCEQRSRFRVSRFRR